MSIKIFTEKEIRKQLLNKIDPKVRTGRSKHQIGWIEFEGRKVLRVKIPNAHSNDFSHKKARILSRSIGLNDGEFNDLIDCPLTGPKYYELLRDEPQRLKQTRGG